MSTEKLLAIKLRELEAQHRELTAHYREVEQRDRSASSDAERLRVLYEGLSQARFAGLPLHPEVSGVEGVLLEAEVETASEQTRGLCLEQLRRALDHGRQRARFAHLFGRVLDEWAAADRSEPDADQSIPGRADFEAWMLELLANPSSMLEPAAVLKDFFDRRPDALSELRAEMERFCGAELSQPVGRNELRAMLKLLSTNPLRPMTLREEARAMLGNDLLIDDYAGALTVIINRNLDTWRWAEEEPARNLGAPRLAWKWDRWRGYFDADLLTTLLLEVIGWRLAIQVKTAVTSNPAFACLEHPKRVDAGSITMTRKNALDELFLASTPTSLSELSRLGGSEDLAYDGFRFTDDSPDASQQMLTMIAADVKLERAASAGCPVHAVHTDVKDYFLTIPHPVIEQLFQGIGLTRPWLGFLRRFVAVPLPGAAGAVARRGIPLGYKLSYVIGDLLLRVLDALVFERTTVRVGRFVDDIYFVTGDRQQALDAWSTIQRFCSDCDLTLNRDKSGSVCVGGDVPRAELPDGPFLWGALQLDADGCWSPHHKTVAELTGHLRRAIERSRSALEVVAQYNGYLNHLIRKLGPFSWLQGRQQPHLEAVIDTMVALHRQILDGQGICSYLRGRLERRFADVLNGVDVSEALLYWPITAGGLGLCHPVLVMLGFRRGLQQLAPVTPPAELPEGRWRNAAGLWSVYYHQQLRTIAPVKPRLPPALEGLRATLLARGNIRSLTTYWEWVIATYGPQLLQRFGAFSVLFPQLVPMQLVISSQIVTSSLDQEMAMAPLDVPVVQLSTDDDIPF